jgi:hypothetical protein
MEAIMATQVVGGVIIGICLTVLLGTVALGSRLRRLQSNITVSEELVKDCQNKQYELDQVIYRASWIEPLKRVTYGQVIGWDLRMHKTVQSLPSGKVLVICTDDLKRQQEELYGTV